MRIERNRDTIQQWIRARQLNEQEMLKRLNRVFQKPQATQAMRQVVLQPLRQMLVEMRGAAPTMGGWHGWTWAQRALMDEHNLAVWQTVPRSMYWDVTLERMIQRLEAGLGDANDISELIRVIGAWLEKGGGLATKDINKAYRVGVRKIARGAPHGQNLAPDQQKAIDDEVWSKAVRQRENPNQHHPIEAHVAPAWVAPKFGKQSGMQMFRVRGNDICLRIDNLFGLLKGATISGTTTDTAMVLEAYGAELGLHPGYYLFPVATIAASLHHTLLEAGLALTLVEAIDSYRVGFYMSLMPIGGVPPELAEIEEILEAAEADIRNRHFILWYAPASGAAPVGAIQWTRPFELQASKRLVEGRGLLTHAGRLPEYPAQADVARFIQLMAPQLLAYLPQEFQPGRVRLSAA